MSEINAGTGTGAGAGTGTGTPPPAAGGEWFNGFSDDLKGYVQQKGFKDASSVVESYRNFEKLQGVPAERILKLPEKLDDDKALNDIFAKLGKPEKSEGYELKVPEGMSDDFSKWAKEAFHGLGLTKRQGENLSQKWTDYALEMNKKAVEDANNAGVQQMEKLKQEWGSNFKANHDLVMGFAKAAGIDEAHIDKLDAALGIDGSSKLLLGIIQKFGIKVGEHGFKGADGSNTFSSMSKEEARSRIATLKTNPEWTSKYLSGSKAELDEMTRLTQIAFSE